ncbi:hypothetical protein GEMRC1_002688 [Eukaryota sp. GEM-RC1]
MTTTNTAVLMRDSSVIQAISHLAADQRKPLASAKTNINVLDFLPPSKSAIKVIKQQVDSDPSYLSQFCYSLLVTFAEFHLLCVPDHICQLLQVHELPLDATSSLFDQGLSSILSTFSLSESEIRSLTISLISLTNSHIINHCPLITLCTFLLQTLHTEKDSHLFDSCFLQHIDKDLALQSSSIVFLSTLTSLLPSDDSFTSNKLRTWLEPQLRKYQSFVIDCFAVTDTKPKSRKRLAKIFKTLSKVVEEEAAKPSIYFILSKLAEVVFEQVFYHHHHFNSFSEILTGLDVFLPQFLELFQETIVQNIHSACSRSDSIKSDCETIVTKLRHSFNSLSMLTSVLIKLSQQKRYVVTLSNTLFILAFESNGLSQVLTSNVIETLRRELLLMFGNSKMEFDISELFVFNSVLKRLCQ